MVLLWTRSTILSEDNDIVTWWLEEPVSHFAIQFFDLNIIHSTFSSGYKMLTTYEFFKTRKTIYSIGVKLSDEYEHRVFSYMRKFIGYPYDWKLFWWLFRMGLKKKILGTDIPMRSSIDSKTGILCTEVFELLPKDIFPNIYVRNVTTPFALYRIIMNDLIRQGRVKDGSVRKN